MEQKGGHFSTGFILGAIIGAAIVFLLATEKGKKILKVISDEGLKNLSELIEESELDEEEVLEEVEPVEEVVEEPKDLENEEAPKKSTKKRFFRRVKK
jgi:gas vesicle protein